MIGKDISFNISGGGISGSDDHSQLSNLDYESSGHTGFASANQDVMDITGTSISLESNKIYRLSISANTTFTLPTITNNNIMNQVMVQATITGTPTINWGTTLFFGAVTPSIDAGGYNFIWEWNGSAWVCGAIKKEVVV